MSMDAEENTVTSVSNTASAHSDNVYGNPQENHSYVDISSNYALDSLPFDTSNSLNYSSAITTFEDDNKDSVTMCDDNMLSANDNILDDDSLNCSTPNRRVRFKYSKTQLRRFEDHFRMNMFPDSIVREEISKELNIPVRNVQVWFKNRRAKHRKSAQMDLSISSYLENSTMLPTPDRNNSFQSSGYAFNNSTSQHFPQQNPHNNSFMMVNHHHPFHGASTNNSSNVSAAASGGAYHMSSPFPAMMGMPAGGNPPNAHVAAPQTNPAAAANMMHHYNPYRGSNHMMPPPFYKGEHKYAAPSEENMNSAGPNSAAMYGTSSNVNANRGPLTNNPFIVNVPPNVGVYGQHYHPQSMAHFNSSLPSQRSMYYQNVNHHPNSSSMSNNNMNPCHNENIPSCNNPIKSEHKANDSNDAQMKAVNDKKQPGGDYHLRENYLNR